MGRVTTGASDLEGFLEARLDAGRPTLGDPVLASHVADDLGRVAGRRILDVGCGTGDLAAMLAAAGAQVWGVDVCARLVARAREGRGFVAADAVRIPFASETFHDATCVLVLHYVADPGRALGEIARVVRPVGRFVLADRIAPDDPEARARQDRVEQARNPFLRRILPSGEIESLLRGAGFEVVGTEDHERAVPDERGRVRCRIYVCRREGKA